MTKEITSVSPDYNQGLTQAQVGAAIQVPQRTYAYYESGQRMVPP